MELIKIDNILNGDFEQGANVYWSDIVLKNDAEASASDFVEDGDTSLKVTISKKGTDEAQGDVQVNSFSLIPFNNAPILVSFKAKAILNNPQEVATAGFGSGYKNTYGKHLAGDNNYGGIFNLTEDYRTYKYVINTIDYSQWIYANISLRFGPEEGDYYMNDFTIGSYAGAPTINSTPVETTDTTSEYTYQVSVDGEMVGKWGLTKPAGLPISIDQYTGLISGQPDTVGVYDLVAYLNTGMDSIGQAFTLTVTEGGSAALNSVEKKSLNVFPTLAQDKINIIGVEQQAMVKVYALSGKLMINDNLNNNQLEVSSLQQGTYIVVCENKRSLIIKK